ncbi:MAG: tRNA (adenosine(37)-N6)-threonylcarbamoyltransferase complex ATPase subunit type 1 TsaE [Bacteroidales bacterium]
MIRKEWKVASIDELPGVAKELLDLDHSRKVMAVYGAMGAGKTTFIKAICRVLGVSEKVTSPTFALVNVYSGTAGEIYHFDVYRIESLHEMYDIGYEDYFYSGNYCLVEWAEKIEPLLPVETTLRVEVLADDATEMRTIRIRN